MFTALGRIPRDAGSKHATCKFLKRILKNNHKFNNLSIAIKKAQQNVQWVFKTSYDPGFYVYDFVIATNVPSVANTQFTFHTGSLIEFRFEKYVLLGNLPQIYSILNRCAWNELLIIFLCFTYLCKIVILVRSYGFDSLLKENVLIKATIFPFLFSEITMFYFVLSMVESHSQYVISFNNSTIQSKSACEVKLECFKIKLN